LKEYAILITAYCLGDIIGLSSIQTLSIVYPEGPMLIQIINLVLFSLNQYYQVITNFNFIFVWCIWIGMQAGICYTNFMFLANAKTNLKEDLNLNFYERELVVNLLLISMDIGNFFAAVLSFGVMQYSFP
jgi:hypothetical protein